MFGGKVFFLTLPPLFEVVMLTLGAAALLGGAALAARVGGSYLDSALSNRNAKKADNRAEGMTFRQLVNQMHVDRALYDYEQSQQYDYTRRYLENSAKWTVQGYRDAGINPILAATKGDLSTTGDSVSMPSVSSGMSSHSAGSTNFSHSLDLAEAARDVATVDNALASSELSRSTAKRTRTLLHGESKLMETKSDLTSAQAQQVKAISAATADKIKAEAEMTRARTAEIEANTARSKINAHNERALGGASGSSIVGQARSVVQGVVDGVRSMYDAGREVLNYTSTPSVSAPASLGVRSNKHSAKPNLPSPTTRNTAKNPVDYSRFLDMVE